jgi:hypothetical protein
MSDLIERLRDMALSAPTIPSCGLCGEAADHIEELEAENERLTAKIKEGSGPIIAWLTDEMNKVRPLEAENKRLRDLLKDAGAESGRAGYWMWTQDE